MRSDEKTRVCIVVVLYRVNSDFRVIFIKKNFCICVCGQPLTSENARARKIRDDIMVKTGFWSSSSSSSAGGSSTNSNSDSSDSSSSTDDETGGGGAADSDGSSSAGRLSRWSRKIRSFRHKKSSSKPGGRHHHHHHHHRHNHRHSTAAATDTAGSSSCPQCNGMPPTATPVAGIICTYVQNSAHLFD